MDVRAGFFRALRIGCAVLGTSIGLPAGHAGAVDAAQAAQTGRAAGIAFPPVLPGRQLAWPADGGAHPDYRIEWWYVTGWLQDEEGTERGFQLTFFRVRSGLGEDTPSRFAPRQLLFAHAAVADAGHGRLIHDQRSARALPPLAHADEGRTGVAIGDWSLAWTEDRYLARIVAAEFAFDLELVPPHPPMLNGKDGFSQKDADPRHASHYYSRPQLRVAGRLVLGGTARQVTGHAWLDHEWSSALMPPGARGWDWIGINLADGGALMAFRMRDADGRALWAGGTWRAGDGRQWVLGPDQVRFLPRRRWRSPRSGAEYPVEWTVDILLDEPRRLRIEPLMDDQELDSRPSTGALYWEGAVRVLDGEHEIGRGYLEMTGYGARPPL